MTLAVEVRGVEKRYGDLRALDGVSLDISEGEFFALLGPNGAGKTTLISALAGLTRVDAGTLKVMGHNVVSDYRKARRALGIVPQEIVFDPFFSVIETLRFQAGYFGIARTPALDDWIDELLCRTHEYLLQIGYTEESSRITTISRDARGAVFNAACQAV